MNFPSGPKLTVLHLFIISLLLDASSLAYYPMLGAAGLVMVIGFALILRDFRKTNKVTAQWVEMRARQRERDFQSQCLTAGYELDIITGEMVLRGDIVE